MKQCTKCGELKPLSEFRKRRNRPGDHQSYCNDCHAQRQRQFRKQHPNKEREYYAANKEKHISRKKVRRAIVYGRLKRAAEYQCAVDNCPNTAAHWHHMNYDPDPAIAPLCTTCHAEIHYGAIAHSAVKNITTLSGLLVSVEEISIDYLKFGYTMPQEVSCKKLTIMKYCKGCRTRKDYTHFSPNARLCADCRTEKAEERRQYLAAWRKANGAATQRAWRKRNPEYDKEYYRRKKERQA